MLRMSPFRWKKKRILIADDEPSVRKVIKSCLAPQGYDVETAENGIDALDKLEKGKFDLLILDQYMPEMKGLQVLETIIVSKKHRNMPVFMLTCESCMGTAERAFELNAVKYIQKPFDIQNLVEKVNSLF